MSRKAVLLAAGVFLLLALPAAAETVTVVNQSQWGIYHFFLSPADTDQWGPDQLGDHVIEPNTSAKLDGVPCDVYDVKLVDQDGDECIVGGVEVCSGDHQWIVTSEDLAVCEGYGGE
jgi:hypothetical protein